MSAFILGPKHISVMLQAASQERGAGDSVYYYWKDALKYITDFLQGIGQKLVDENCRSVNCRYNRSGQPYEFRYMPESPRTPLEIIRACDCYNYQACETPDWKDSEAYAIVQALRDRAIGRLDGYNDAPWCFD